MRLPRLSHAWDHLYWNYVDVAWEWLNRGIRLDALLGVSAIAATVAAVIWGVPEKQLSPGVGAFYSVVAALGMLLIVLRAVLVLLDGRMDPRANRFAPLRAIVRGQFCLLWATALIQFAQAPLERFFVRVSNLSAENWGLLGGLVVFAGVATWIFRLREEPLPPFIAMAIEPETLGHKVPESHYRTAVHEAGHALLLAALPHSTDLALVIRAEGERVLNGAGHRQLGVVKAAIPDKHARTEEGLAFRMRLALAGMVAERLVYGQATLGSSSDQETWMVVADLYLKNGFAGPYYGHERGRLTSEQRRSNQAALHALHAQHVAEVRGFLAQHLSLVFDMAQKAVSQGTLNQDELAVFFTKVRLPQGWALDGGDPLQEAIPVASKEKAPGSPGA